jgi:dCMP deaminase
MNRISRDQLLIDYTKLVARRGTCKRAKVGCVISRDGRVIVQGYNGSLPGEPHCEDVGCDMQDGHCVRTVHAELNAILYAARKGISVEGTTLYTYGWKEGICHRCRKAALMAGIIRIIEIPFDPTYDLKERNLNDAAPVRSPELNELLETARRHVMTPEEVEAQRQSWVRGEQGIDAAEKSEGGHTSVFPQTK